MRFPFFRNRDSVKNGILISIRRTGDGFHPGLFNHMQDTETTAFVELPAPAPDPKKTDTPKESGTCISAGTLPMIRIKNTRGLSAEIFSGTSPEMLCHLIKAFTHAE